MKITVNIDCTPAEAREFMGLPDVKPMQDGVMEEVEKRIRANLDQLTPQSILQMWMSASPSGMQDMFKRMLDMATPKANGP